MIVAPGFIDPHTHVGEDLASDDARTRLIPAFLMQGVTTAFIGNDGGGDPDVASGAGQRRGAGRWGSTMRPMSASARSAGR